MTHGLGLPIHIPLCHHGCLSFRLIIYARGRHDQPYSGSDADGKLDGSDQGFNRYCDEEFIRVRSADQYVVGWNEHLRGSSAERNL